MDTRKCAALLHAIDLGSLSAAARYLGYTPSGLLRMIDSFEAELGMEVVERGRHGVTLTSEGRQVIGALRDAVRAAERVEQEVACVKGLLSGVVSIATYTSIAETWLPHALGVFEQRHPGVKVLIREGGNEEMMAWVEKRVVDCALVAKRSFSGDWIELAQDRLMAWLPASHPRAKDGFFPIEELDGAPFIETLPGQNTDITRLVHAEELALDVRYTTTSSHTTYRMVEEGLGISINNELMTRHWHGNVAVVPLAPERMISLGVALPSLAAASAATREFVECAKQACDAWRCSDAGE